MFIYLQHKALKRKLKISFECTMNIAILFDAMYEQGVGSLVSTLRFSELLKQKGHHIIFIASTYPGRPKVEMYHGFKVYRFPSLTLPKTEKKFRICFPRSKELIKIFKKENIDILHIMMATPAAVTAVKVAQKLGLKIVAHSHTQPENILLHAPWFLQGKSVNAWVYKYIIWLYKKADIIICPSKFAEKILKKYDAHLHTVVISNGIDSGIFKKVSSSTFSRKFHLIGKNVKILFVGRIAPEKNISVIIKAMPKIVERFPTIEAVIIGFGPLRHELEQLAQRLGVGRYVKFLGRVSHDDLVGAYSACDIFVLPSYAELEGIVVLEAMSCGMPIIIADSKNSASVDFVDGNGFLFKANDPASLAEKILKLCHDKTLRKKMGKKSLVQSKKYDIRKSITMIEKVYTSLCSKHTGAIRVGEDVGQKHQKKKGIHMPS